MIDIGTDRLGPAGDLFYDRLIRAHAGLDPEASQRLNMRLVLLMANAIGDARILEAVLDAAKGSSDD
ncbi:uncharacterized protein DUF2783 [Hoeflea marina]|uniref:Uncharacterized protein DUF2783 n=1 Tax=Hoeflea marina TaxID=274592 RepID=A0A317PTA6_9HYPH|nr:DUF2783 domain-containing protein [Hoeflea marina]PWW04167.1 uncharacterized protein DUF2783 [Hoeflea marina]